MFGLSVPDGWIFDDELGRSMGMCLAAYPSGTTIETAPVVLTVLARSKGGDDCDGLAEYIDADVEAFRVEQPGLVVDTLCVARESGGRDVPLLTFHGLRFGQRVRTEIVGYLEEERVFVVFSLSAASDSLAGVRESDLRAMISRYGFFGTDEMLRFE